MLQLLKSYFPFLKNSTNQHGVHSPFVFRLVTKCFYDKTRYPEYKILNEYRNTLLQNHETIQVTDFGAGSRVFKSNTRKISAIAKNAGISKKRAELLFRIVRYFQPESILEIGTSLGLATSALALGNPKAKITSLEGCSVTSQKSKVECQKFGFDNIEFINTEFSEYLKTFGFRLSTFNIVYFDGNHSKKATLEYFELLLPTITNESVWIFDDIHWSKDMEEAWTVIKNHPKVTVTIDTFQWGFVFFRREQEKEHFIIRI
ncbi:class I SAM-dependent methyltransferase [Flavobacterium columnare]|uniref:O-methyltransferase n=1 Tax=Flavobacterium columnare TaxID=996 RepID=UPI00178664FA|nr:class I SAM-dependent methyltransferase [Flavobacterium columnare]QOG91079.1 class I SAM-dependent methyltransferase [Flavobacterium columnare]QOG93733.1 class I SAM-dependent methyltransferase [Flavobacterium columnare]QOG96400.1 class I SAM-dependent methyltransferase [Flavobacterium columnare]QOG99059.1 class I SAM-dependent methyltransferase [Flavobacterium columnare]QOH01718.1 class I SAM-dependent methyltransferase [Flavobacterium columnare]